MDQPHHRAQNADGGRKAPSGFPELGSGLQFLFISGNLDLQHFPETLRLRSIHQ